MDKFRSLGAWAGALGLAVVATGCGSGSSTEQSTLTVNGDVAIAYAKRVNTIGANPLSAGPTAPGGDLMIREKSSPSAIEHNMTAQFTMGKGDVMAPDVSYDGKKIVFSMRCPASNPVTINGQPACTGHWNIWEYDMTTGGLTGGTFRRITASNGDDIEPTYLPAGRGYVFTSNRQTKSSVNQALGYSYFALDEYERQRVFNLHTMDADGNNITQISFNQSHDRNPTIRPNGDIMFSRWDHVGGRNHFKVFRAKPDGTDMFVLYGAHSPGNSFLHPRDMDPNGKFKGFLSSDLMPLSGTKEGGGLVFIDAANYSENGVPASPLVPANGGQKQATAVQLNIDKGISLYGRITSPFPLWDGTDRVLVSYTPCQVNVRPTAIPGSASAPPVAASGSTPTVTSCASIPAADLARISMGEMRLATEVANDPIQDNVPPSYAIYMFDPAQQTFTPVAVPDPGFMLTHPVAIQPRAEPSAPDPTPVDATLAAQNLGLLEVRSVYDTDGLGRMGEGVVAPSDLSPGCAASIAKTSPTDPADTRPQIADLVRMKDPADPAYNCAPAKFIRAVRAVAPPTGMTGMRGAIGETEFEMQQVLGYAPIEPDGSFKLEVPADTPIGLAVVDKDGRAFQTHTNWIQVRPGERRTCDGCHSPRRGGAINSGAVVNSVPAALQPAMANAHLSGETMAATRTRLDASALRLAADMVSADIWADTTKPGVTAKPTLIVKYTGNPNPADDLATAAPQNGIINYPEHVAPIWTRNRGANTCTNCHNDPAKLDLGTTIAGSGRVVSYDELMLGDPLIDPVTGMPVTRIEEGVLVIARGPALVDTMASEGDALGMARKSRLVEIMWGHDLFAGSDARTMHPNPPNTAPDHSQMLNAAEKRVIAEWIDTGSKYYNDPFNPNNGMLRVVNGLDEDTFTQTVFPILQTTCAALCHQAVGSSSDPVPPGTSFRNNRFVLTGEPDGDYGVTLTMVSDACNPASNLLLKKPSTVPHPPNAVGVNTAVLPVGSANYNAIANWIAGGC